MRRHPRGEAGRRADPLRGRAGRRGARSQAQAAGPRTVGHGGAGDAEGCHRAQRLRARLQARGPRHAGARRSRPNACWSAPRSMRWPSRGNRDWSRPVSPRPRRRSPATRSSACCTHRMPAPTASPSSPARCAGADDAERIAVIKAFTTAQLDLALGRSNVVHAALLAGPANDTFLARFARLERFRTGETGQGGTGRDRK